MSCIFCDIVANRAPAEIVWSDEQFVAFLDIMPIAPSHTLIVPRAHVTSVFELPEQQYADLFERVRFLERVVQQVAGSGRVGVAIEGFGVDHAHVHLVPVDRAGDMDPCRAALVPRAELHAQGERLRAAIASVAR